MEKLSPEAKTLLQSMQKGDTVTYRIIGDEAWINSDYIQVRPSVLIELKKNNLIEIQSYDENVGWVIYKAITKG